MQQEQVLLLKEKIKRLEVKLQHVDGKLSKNSRNSSKPPSCDTNKPPKTTRSKKSLIRTLADNPTMKGII